MSSLWYVLRFLWCFRQNRYGKASATIMDTGVGRWKRIRRVILTNFSFFILFEKTYSSEYPATLVPRASIPTRFSQLDCVWYHLNECLNFGWFVVWYIFGLPLVLASKFHLVLAFHILSSCSLISILFWKSFRSAKFAKYFQAWRFSLQFSLFSWSASLCLFTMNAST